METPLPTYPPQPVMLVFNPLSGGSGSGADQLMEILTQLQAHNFQPEVHLVEQGSDLAEVVKEGMRRRFRLFVAAGGDGTIDTVASALAGTSATLGIIPQGTQNNVALSLGLPSDIPSAVALLRCGRKIKVDMARAVCGGQERVFLEAASVGLLSALFPAADDIQHGQIARIGDLLSTLISFPEAAIRLKMDDQPEMETRGHVLLAANMPFIGPHYRLAPEGAHQDGFLDVLLYANLTKLDLISTVVQAASTGADDPRIHRYRVRSLVVDTDPPMPVLVDGFPLGEGRLQIWAQRRALNVMAGEPPAAQANP